MTKLTGRGGPNRNQGRRPKPPDQKHRQFRISLPPEMADWLERQPSKSKVIQGLIAERMNKIDYCLSCDNYFSDLDEIETIQEFNTCISCTEKSLG